MTIETLAEELQTFEDRLPELLAGIAGHVGEVATFALIKGSEVIGTYSSKVDAQNIGYDELGLAPFLVAEITPYPNPATFTRDML